MLRRAIGCGKSIGVMLIAGLGISIGLGMFKEREMPIRAGM